MQTTRRTRQRLGLLLTAAATAGVLAGPGAVGATAATTALTPAKVTAAGSVTDPDDTAGRLDVRRVSYHATQVSPRHVRLTYRVRTWTPFATSFLDLDDRNFVLDLNRDTEPGAEREVLVAARDGALVADVISPATRMVIGTVTVTRPSPRTIQISGARRVLGARSYFWTSNDHVDGSRACGDWHGAPLDCQDDVPDDSSWLRLDSPAWPAQP